MKQAFLTKVDLPDGSVLTMIRAESREELNERYPELLILDARPPWLTDELLAKIEGRTIDLDTPDPFLEHLVEQRSKG
jgi:hypothetical protein